MINLSSQLSSSLPSQLTTTLSHTTTSVIQAFSLCKKIEKIWSDYGNPGSVNFFDNKDSRWSKNTLLFTSQVSTNPNDCAFQMTSISPKVYAKSEMIGDVHTIELENVHYGSLKGKTDFKEFMEIDFKNRVTKDFYFKIERSKKKVNENFDVICKNDIFSFLGECELGVNEGVCEGRINFSPKKFPRVLEHLFSLAIGGRGIIHFKRHSDSNENKILKIKIDVKSRFPFLFPPQILEFDLKFGSTPQSDELSIQVGNQHQNFTFSTLMQKIDEAYFFKSESKFDYPDGLYNSSVRELNATSNAFVFKKILVNGSKPELTQNISLEKEMQGSIIKNCEDKGSNSLRVYVSN